MTTLTTDRNKFNAPKCLEQIDLTSRIPLADQAGWFSVLYGQFPAAELFLSDSPEERPNRRVLDAAARAVSLKFLLIDLDRHPWLAHEDARLTELDQDARARGLRIVPYTGDSLPFIATSVSREAAIELCLREWEEHLLDRFWW